MANLAPSLAQAVHVHESTTAKVCGPAHQSAHASRTHVRCTTCLRHSPVPVATTAFEVCHAALWQVEIADVKQGGDAMLLLLNGLSFLDDTQGTDLCEEIRAAIAQVQDSLSTSRVTAFKLNPPPFRSQRNALVRRKKAPLCRLALATGEWYA